MKAVKRKKPLSARGHFIFLVLGSLITILTLVRIFMAPAEDRSLMLITCSPLLLIGGLWTLVAAFSFLRRNSDYRMFKRSVESSTGVVLERYTESLGDDTYYHIVFKFEPDPPMSESSHLVLDADVTVDLYNRLEPNSNLEIRYAKEDPRIAFIENEWTLFGFPTKI